MIKLVLTFCFSPVCWFGKKEKTNWNQNNVRRDREPQLQLAATTHARDTTLGLSFLWWFFFFTVAVFVSIVALTYDLLSEKQIRKLFDLLRRWTEKKEREEILDEKKKRGQKVFFLLLLWIVVEFEIEIELKLNFSFSTFNFCSSTCDTTVGKNTAKQTIYQRN